jgi:hypothetical protein
VVPSPWQHSGPITLASDRVPQRLLADAGRHLATAAAGLDADDFAGAYQLAYDALRKSAAALLAVQGLRATSRGGHLAVQEAVTAQFGTTGRVARSSPRMCSNLGEGTHYRCWVGFNLDCPPRVRQGDERRQRRSSHRRGTGGDVGATTA